MPRYVAFLRGINVGGHRLKMDRLRQLFLEIGFKDVSTFIASGNVIFSTEESDETRLAARIEAHFQASLGYAAATFLRTLPALQEVVERRPFELRTPPFAEAGTYVIFLAGTPGAGAQEALAALETSDDWFAVVERECYWLRNGRLSDSAVPLKLVGRALGEEGTMRNMTTLRRLLEKYA